MAEPLPQIEHQTIRLHEDDLLHTRCASETPPAPFEGWRRRSRRIPRWYHLGNPLLLPLSPPCRNAAEDSTAPLGPTLVLCSSVLKASHARVMTGPSRAPLETSLFLLLELVVVVDFFPEVPMWPNPDPGVRPVHKPPSAKPRRHQS